jgi:predicted NAD-dependent protein-ADP-ribosyltransferase YbiA (DUF1768 family)
MNENNKDHNIYVYKFMRDNGGYDNFDMILIETKCLTNSLEARREERKHLEELNASLNSCIPSRTRQEYREVNKNVINERQKKYDELNKEVINERKRERYEQNKEKF